MNWKNTLVIRYEDLKEKGEQFIVDGIGNFLNLNKFNIKLYDYKYFKYPPMKKETRKELVEYFKPYNQKLYKLLDRDFKWD